MAAATADQRRQAMHLRHSIAPRVLDNTVPMGSLYSNSRFSVRVAAPETAPISSAANILTTFIWRDPGARVFVAGSFDDWRKHQMIYVPDVKYHILVTELPPGEYFYRFVVDGRYRVADGDPNLREDQFGELSHFISISVGTAASAPPKRFSSVVVAATDVATNETVVDKGESDTESDDATFSDVEEAPLPELPLPARQRGSVFIRDYDDDMYAGLDLQADVFEAMKDVAEINTDPAPRESSPTRSRSQSTMRESSARSARRPRPGGRMLRKIWALLFRDHGNDENESAGANVDRLSRPTHNQKVYGLATHENALRKGLKVWFPNERDFPGKVGAGRKVAPEEQKEVIDVGDTALKLRQVEENANSRQMLGKNLFAQGKFDASLALFSLSVKLREDNGLKYAKTTAIAHTDVASAFIQLEDLKNAEKHLNKAMAIYSKGTFSGGKVHLADVHCFLGVVCDMRGQLKEAEDSYQKAIELYEKIKGVDDNPNYATAVENLNNNLRRQLASQPLPRASARKSAALQRVVEQVALASPPPPQDVPHSQTSEYRQDEPWSAVSHNAAPRNLGIPPAPTPPRKKPVMATKETASVKPFEPSRPVLPSSLLAQKSQIKPLEASRPAPAITLESTISVIAPKQAKAENRSPMNSVVLDPNVGGKRRSSRPDTWEELAKSARESMPSAPPVENVGDQDEDGESPTGSYEEMCRMWHTDARALLGEGKYKEAIELYTLAIYTRKRNGPWVSRENADTLVECARAQLATRQLEDSVGMLKDAIDVLEKLSIPKHKPYLGEVWGNLGSVLDRLGGRQEEARNAHCAGMVVYGKAGMSTEDPKWTKAWKSLCVNLKMNGKLDSSDEVWRSIDLQIRGVAQVTKAANVVVMQR